MKSALQAAPEAVNGPTGLPMIVASITFVVGSLLLRETHGTKIWDQVGGHPALSTAD